MAVNIEKEEIEKIFFKKYLPKCALDTYIKLPIKSKELKKIATDGAFSSIYTFIDAEEKECVLKVLSTTRTETEEGSVENTTENNTAAFNEILALHYSALKKLDVVVMIDCFEYKPESSLYEPEQLAELKNEYIYFIIMPKYTTFGQYFNTKKNSEKDIYDLAISLLNSLRGIHEPVDFSESYSCLKNDGIITFDNGYIKPGYIENYENKRILLHKDIKTGNFLVTSKGKVLFSDFGAINLLDPLLDPMKESNNLYPNLGTEKYAAPEIRPRDGKFKGCKTNSDIYSLGVTLKELLPCDENGGCRTDLITQEFLDILDKMTEYDPDERYDTENEVLSDLERICDLISDIPFPQASNEFTKFKILLAERNINELYKEAQRRYNENSEDAFNIRFYSYAKACYNGIKSRKDFEEVVEIIKPLIESNDKVALCLPYIYYENMGDKLANGEFNSFEKSDFLRMLKASCDEGYIPAKYLFAKRVCRSPGFGGVTANEVVEMFDELMEEEFVPALRYYRKLLLNPAEKGCVYDRLNRNERNDRIEKINEVLAEKDEKSMASMFFEYLY